MLDSFGSYMITKNAVFCHMYCYGISIQKSPKKKSKGTRVSALAGTQTVGGRKSSIFEFGHVDLAIANEL